ncbi:hypothetical protein [Reyranella sp.]|uniref:hypothetical protein n=1 Tax=Reyranella sp. TaxID=1929291 RepID=UPI002F95DF3B
MTDNGHSELGPDPPRRGDRMDGGNGAFYTRRGTSKAARMRGISSKIFFRALQRPNIGLITAFLLAGVGAGSFLYASHVEATKAAAKRAADGALQAGRISPHERLDAMQREPAPATREQASKQARDTVGTPTRDVVDTRRETRGETARKTGNEAAQAKEAMEPGAASAQQALKAERAWAEALARDLEAALREVEAQKALAHGAGGEAAQAKQAVERTAATAQQALREERGRSEALALDLATARRQSEAQAAASARLGDDALRRQQSAERSAAEFEQALKEERDKAEKLARDLAMARHQLETQTTAVTEARDTKADDQQLAILRQALKESEASAVAYQESLVQERARNQKLEEKLAAGRDAAPDREGNAVSLPKSSASTGVTLASVTDRPATTPLPAGDSKPPIAAGPTESKPATMTPRPTAQEGRTNPETDRLMARASRLLIEGNVGAARIVLDRAAELGNAQALFALAETYDPLSLSAWGTLGTQGDTARARELYGQALTGGVQEAKDRLNALGQ